MPNAPEIRSDFSDGLESQLLSKVCRQQKRHNVYVSSFRRFGLSGARLLLIYFDREPKGVPFLLKVASLKKTQDEYDATKALGLLVQEARLAADCVFSAKDPSGKKFGALLYIHHGADGPVGAADPKALRELIYDPEMPLPKLRKILSEVFAKLNNAHSKVIAKKVLLGTHFKSYLRRHNAPRRGSRFRIGRVLAPNAARKEIAFLGARIFNPLKYVDVLSKHAYLLVAPVHGDLHPDNVVIDRKEMPHLIDFAWARGRRDVLVDFTLMENSIRFMAFPRPINLADQLMVDRALVYERGFDRIPSLKLCTEEHREDYERLACAVGIIRERARTLLGPQFSMRRYLLTQFILLYGLLRYNDYEPYASTRALGLIAARLRKIGLPSSRVN